MNREKLHVMISKLMRMRRRYYDSKRKLWLRNKPGFSVAVAYARLVYKKLLRKNTPISAKFVRILWNL